MVSIKHSLLLISTLLISAPLVCGQLSKIAVVDFEKAVVESVEGKKSSDKFTGTLQSRQTEGEKRQKELEDIQRRLQTQERTLSDTAKANLQKDIEKRTTELQRFNEDAQKELQSLRDELLRPIAERATAILHAMAAEGGYTLVVDLSNQQNNVLWFNPKNDVTEELVRRINADTSNTSDAARPPASAPAAPRARTPGPAAPRPVAPPPVAPRKP